MIRAADPFTLVPGAAIFNCHPPPRESLLRMSGQSRGIPRRNAAAARRLLLFCQYGDSPPAGAGGGLMFRCGGG
ncbi:MAG: hypothetical protein GMKNLPBB_00681 [Myxococcota bacterium]|nr:hypothetical protein [Myxococcota bacterium]